MQDTDDMTLRLHWIIPIASKLGSRSLWDTSTNTQAQTVLTRADSKQTLRTQVKCHLSAVWSQANQLTVTSCKWSTSCKQKVTTKRSNKPKTCKSALTSTKVREVLLTSLLTNSCTRESRCKPDSKVIQAPRSWPLKKTVNGSKAKPRTPHLSNSLQLCKLRTNQRKITIKSFSTKQQYNTWLRESKPNSSLNSKYCQSKGTQHRRGSVQTVLKRAPPRNNKVSKWWSLCMRRFSQMWHCPQKQNNLLWTCETTWSNLSQSHNSIIKSETTS